jgi:hypothetical protein
MAGGGRVGGAFGPNVSRGRNRRSDWRIATHFLGCGRSRRNAKQDYSHDHFHGHSTPIWKSFCLPHESTPAREE